MSEGEKDVTLQRIPRCQATRKKIGREGDDARKSRPKETDVPPKRADVERVSERTKEESEPWPEHCRTAKRVRKRGTNAIGQDVREDVRLVIPPDMRPVRAKHP